VASSHSGKFATACTYAVVGGLPDARILSPDSFVIMVEAGGTDENDYVAVHDNRSARDRERRPRAGGIRRAVESAPSGIRYASYRLADGLTFLHVATIDTPDANPLIALPSFKNFQKDLGARCVEPPVVTELSPIGSYESRP
jgi:hypothetical protein